MNQQEIMRLLPHRDNMLLVDQAEVCPQEGEEQRPTRCKGNYTVTGEEWFLKGHFPGNPVVPGVVLCEMMGTDLLCFAGAGPAGKKDYPLFYQP